MNYVHKSIVAICFFSALGVSAVYMVSQNNDPVDKTVVEQVSAIEVAPLEDVVTVEEDLYYPEINEPVEAEVTFVAVDLEPVEVIPELSAAEEVTIYENAFRSQIMSANAYVCPQEYGKGKPCKKVNTSDCITQTRGEYRTCTTRMLKQKYQDIVYGNTDWSATSYEDTYFIP